MIKKIIILSVVSLCVLVGALAVSAKTTNSASKQMDLSCMKTAVEKRETAMQSAFDKFSSSIKSALQSRKSALSAAWSITDKKERNTAIKTAWANFKTSKKSTVETFRTERLAAWKQFVKNRKECKSGSTGENPGDDLSL